MDKFRFESKLNKLENDFNLVESINKIISRNDFKQDPFYVLNLDDVYDKYINWIQELPRVKSFYAVKCNNDSVLLQLLANLGLNFDCASKNEIQTILDLGVTPDRIIYANPCKQSTYLEYAREKGVDCMTFDNEDELYKIKEIYPDAKLVLRILTDDKNALCKFSTKFGADMETSHKLIDTAFKLKLNLVGISFHVGSGQLSSEAFKESIINSRLLFDYVEKTHSHKMNLLDIGGGFPGSLGTMETFKEIAQDINESLDTYFPKESGVEIIAEPGRYFSASACTVIVNIIARRVIQNSDSKSFMYYANDGIFGSFNSLIYDHIKEFPPILLREISSNEPVYKTSICGPTCDGSDFLIRDCVLPELRVGEYVAFLDMGSYTLASSSKFNGMPSPLPVYLISEQYWEKLAIYFK